MAETKLFPSYSVWPAFYTKVRFLVPYFVRLIYGIKPWVTEVLFFFLGRAGKLALLHRQRAETGNIRDAKKLIVAFLSSLRSRLRCSQLQVAATNNTLKHKVTSLFKF